MTGGYYSDPSAFAMPLLGSNGSYRLPQITGPSFFNADISLAKEFKVAERGNIGVSISGFNFINRPNNSFVSQNTN